MRKGNRRSNIANRTQNGNWLQRFRKDGVLPYGKRKAKKITPAIAPKSTKKIPHDKVKNFCNHLDIVRLSRAVSKVQIEGLNIFINEAKKDSKKAIMISFMPTERTKNYLEDKGCRVKRANLRKKGPNKPPKQKILISW